MNDKLEPYPTNKFALTTVRQSSGSKNKLVKLENCPDCNSDRGSNFLSRAISPERMYDRNGRRFVGSNRFFKFAIQNLPPDRNTSCGEVSLASPNKGRPQSLDTK